MEHIIGSLRATVMTAKNIDREDLRPGTGSRIDIALAGLLVLLGCALFLYLSHALVTKVWRLSKAIRGFFRDEITSILSAMHIWVTTRQWSIHKKKFFLSLLEWPAMPWIVQTEAPNRFVGNDKGVNNKIVL
jgi:hypothetical protein